MEIIALILGLAVLLLVGQVVDLKKEVGKLERRIDRGPEVSYRALVILNRRLKGLQKKGIE